MNKSISIQTISSTTRLLRLFLTTTSI